MSSLLRQDLYRDLTDHCKLHLFGQCDDDHSTARKCAWLLHPSSMEITKADAAAYTIKAVELSLEDTPADSHQI
jgi:hypothetical protein